MSGKPAKTGRLDHHLVDLIQKASTARTAAEAEHEPEVAKKLDAAIADFIICLKRTDGNNHEPA